MIKSTALMTSFAIILAGCAIGESASSTSSGSATGGDASVSCDQDPAQAKCEHRTPAGELPTANGGGGGVAPKTVLAPNSEYSIQSGKPLYRVWYGTNRKPIDDTDSTKGFSELRDAVLHYGTAIVYVPQSHSFGSVGSSWIYRLVTLTDDRLKVEQINPLTQEDFVGALRDTLGKRLSGERKALVYVPGFNTTFNEAVIRAAQIGFDLTVEGITALYSWPSKGGGLTDYSADEATSEASEPFLVEFLSQIALQSNVEEVNVIAHSMGNRVLLRAVSALELAVRQSGKKLGQIILAAPDVDADVFKNLAKAYPAISSRTTLYISSKDRAVQSSAILHQYERVGFYPPVLLFPGIDTVQVSNVDLTILGHSYYGDAAPVLNDMWMLLHGYPPNKRPRLSPHPMNKLTYWEISQ